MIKGATKISFAHNNTKDVVAIWSCHNHEFHISVISEKGLMNSFNMVW